MLSDHRRAQLAEALLEVFPEGTEELRMLASLYKDDGLPRHLPEQATPNTLVYKIVQVATEGVLESFVRNARRQRPDNDALSKLIPQIWPFEDGLDFLAIDRLLEQLVRSGISYELLLKQARAVVGPAHTELWVQHGPEPRGDLLEGLAQHPGVLARVARRFANLAGVAQWLEEPKLAADAMASDPVPFRQRMLLVLRHRANDSYSGDVYFSDRDGRPRFVAALREPVPLHQIPSMFKATRSENEDLRAAFRGVVLEIIEVMLHAKDLLTPVEQWDLFDSGAIGEFYPVVVRPLERAYNDQFHEYDGGAMLARRSWAAVKGTAAIRQLDLSSADFATMIRQCPTQWCIAAFHCTELANQAQLARIEHLLKRGAIVMLGVRHAHSWPQRLSVAATLPAAVHEHRCGENDPPVMLLWDDVDFNPGSRT